LDATNTKLPDAYFTHILLSFGPMAIHDWRSAIREIHRMLRPGGGGANFGVAAWRVLIA